MSTHLEAVPVVVVGAGPTGVTAATLLANYGVEVLLLDRWSDVYPQPRAVHLDDEVHRILARLGVAEEFAAISRPSQGLRLLDADHEVLAEFKRDEKNGRHGYPQANMFDQPELEAVLRTNLKHHPSVSFRRDVEVVAVEQPEDGPIHVEICDRVSGRRETVLARYLLGCDGANSVVRTAIGSTMRDLRFEQRWLVVDVNTDRELAQWEGVHQVCDTDRAATYMQITERRHRWEFQLKEGEAASDFEAIAALMPLIRPWTGTVAPGDLELARVAEYTFRAQLADRWRDRHVFLLGDAAHLTPPFIGQGMGAGLRDADNLAWKLAAVIGGRLDPSVLDTYEAERKPHARKMIGLAMLVGTLMTRGGRVGDALRKLVAPRARLVPGIRTRLLDSATPPLRSRSLPTRRRDRLVGTLCPNALLGDGTRFDDGADGWFRVVTTEDGGELAEWLRAAHARGARVRPDGTVAETW